MDKVEFLIVGGGIIGLSIAKAIVERKNSSDIIILEKEPDVSLHASGRNSGVLHSGIYYPKKSLKAKFTKTGNKIMKEYCADKNIKVNNSRKIIVTKNNAELKILNELYLNANSNNINIQMLSEQDLKSIEPNVKTYKKALYSLDTATVDPKEVSWNLKNDLIKKNIKFYFNEGYKKRETNNCIRTTKGNLIKYKVIINCAGLYADKVAHEFGFGLNYSVMPFKGTYLKYTPKKIPIHTNIYPVPSKDNPFLGVHFTFTAEGVLKIGPTAAPAFWRENYKGFDNFCLSELLEIIKQNGSALVKNSFNYRSHAKEELKKMSRAYLISLASDMVKDIDLDGFSEWMDSGIRAQLIKKNDLSLVSDFIVEGDINSVHVLNAVSPAFTSSLYFSQWIVDKYLK